MSEAGNLDPGESRWWHNPTNDRTELFDEAYLQRDLPIPPRKTKRMTPETDTKMTDNTQPTRIGPPLLPSTAVANWFIQRAKECDTSTSISILLRLVYLSHGYSLALLGHPLVIEYTQAAPWGPSYPGIRDHAGTYGSGEIPPGTQLSWKQRFPEAVINVDDKDSRNFLLKRIWTCHGWMSANQLVSFMFDIGPWWSQNKDAIASPKCQSGANWPILDDEVIKQHFLDWMAKQ